MKPHRLSATGFVGDRLRERGVELVEHVASEDGRLPSLGGFGAVVVMGAPWSVYGPEVEPWIGDAFDLLREADRRAIGVLGVCFGAQAMAAAHGREVRKAERPELGWNEVETLDPRSVPAGPWFMWHSDTFELPDGAREVARTALGPQAYVLGPHVCVQFHPEVDAEIVGSWFGHDPSDLVRAGLSLDGVLAETREREPEARARASTLVDRFLDRNAKVASSA